MDEEPKKQEETKDPSSALMSPITQTSALESTEKKKRQYINNNLQRMIHMASKIEKDHKNKRAGNKSPIIPTAPNHKQQKLSIGDGLGVIDAENPQNSN